VPESSTSPPPGDDEWADFDLKKFVLDTIKTIEWHGHETDVLRQQVLRIEECVIAPWPRRWLLWRRLRREVRASVATFGDEYIPRNDFIGRRSEYTFQRAMQIYDMEHPSQRRERAAEPGEQDGADPGADPGEELLP
jgi:hypothetical protein